MSEARDPLRPARFVLLGLALALAWLGGCASNQAASSSYNAQFATGKYAAAYESSSKAAMSMKTIDRDQASLVAGLSARALGHDQDAKRWLTPLVINADPAVTGKACVALGAIAQEEGRRQEAAELFTKAGTRLTGDDAAHAFMCAGDCLKALHKPAEAMDMYQQAKAKLVSDQQLRIAIGDRLADGPSAGPTSNPHALFTVQTGAFSTLKRAKSEARRFQSRGTTTTIPIMDRSGKTLYAVQVGRFTTKQDAERVRKALGSGAIVAEVVQ